MEGGFSIVVDGFGAAYVTGYTESTDFPATPDAFDITYNGSATPSRSRWPPTAARWPTPPTWAGVTRNVALASRWIGSGRLRHGLHLFHRLSHHAGRLPMPPTTAAKTPSWSRCPLRRPAGLRHLLGGGNEDRGYGVAVDGSDVAYVTGWTRSSDFPTTPDAFDITYNGSDDAFVVKVAPYGGALPTPPSWAGVLGIIVKASRWMGAGGLRRGQHLFHRLSHHAGRLRCHPNGSSDAFVVKVAPRRKRAGLRHLLGREFRGY